MLPPESGSVNIVSLAAGIFVQLGRIADALEVANRIAKRV
jgi:hypothetical protein